ncbi:MAG TPA: formyltransferase family protein [bacterium]|nr:formyltransferase family protein [bacterium]
MKGIIICSDDEYFTNSLIEEVIKSIRSKFNIRIERCYIIKDYFDFNRTYKTLLILGLKGIIKLLKIQKKKLFDVCKKLDLQNYEYNEDTLVNDDFDIAFVFNSNKIFRKELLDKTKFGFLNLHFGPLPFYRGIMPAFWQHFFNEKKLGITYYKMDTGLDTGDILYQDKIEILNSDNLVDIYYKGFKSSREIIIKGIENLLNNQFIKQTTLSNEFSYFGMPKLSNIIKYKFKNVI